ncbi:Serine/threonine protein kinase [Micromonospora pattaloongensis]|uniref:non-specific serine/threonine protein kinase n=1 Tax=Micromonospora pattaloongensis TaxID=405436 RepID=A0A1H3HUF1_9ACTN|nr:protein kinase family protein [Micromonospora pattaloongensis]SDY19123.1 Serine/threonine protein kinase [Micromonospora pattaloongensis]
MTKVGEGQEAEQVAPPVVTFGAPTVGEILADRYELAEHINDDSAGRQVWRGVDVVLRRPVAVVLRYPGGDSAMEMLTAAVAASRVIHPNLVGVYDAIDEGERAYVVREWVDGEALREVVAEGGPLDPGRATSVAHAVAGAVAAVHATGMVHGNIHPGTVMIGHDARVVLADARADGGETHATDVRAIGGVLYFALTGHWPHAEAGASTLPDAVRDASGTIAAPRQVRAGIPAYLDDLTMDLLDPRVEAPSSDVLAAELARLDAAAEEHYLEDPGPLRFASTDEPADPPRATNRKLLAGVAALVVIAIAGLFFGINALGNGSGDNTADPTNPPNASAGAGEGTNAPVQKPQKIALGPDQVRVVDPDGQRDELDGVEAAVDGNIDTGWKTDAYVTSPKFGNIKQGMGILIDLKQERSVTSVQVVLSAPGASAQLLSGASDPGSSKSGDEQLLKAFKNGRIGEPLENHRGTTMAFSGFSPDLSYRYLLVWITELPPASEAGKFQIGVQEITVEGR